MKSTLFRSVLFVLLLAAGGQMRAHQVFDIPDPYADTAPADRDSPIQSLSARHFKHPNDPDFTRQLAELYAAQKQSDSAISYWQQYISLRPDNDMAFASLALLYYDRGSSDSAIEAISKAINIYHDHTPYLSLLAAANYQAHKEDTALNICESILSLESNNISALLLSGIILRNQHKTEQAFERFDKCVTAAPSNTEALLYRAEEYVLLKKYNAALKDYTAARADLSTNADVLNNIGICHYESGNYQTAIAFFRKAIMSDRNHPQSYFNKGMAYYHLHDLDTASVDIKTASELWDSCHRDTACHAAFQDAVYYLAICYKKTGNLSTSKKYFELLQKDNYPKDLNEEIKYIDRAMFLSANWYYMLALVLLFIALIIAAFRIMRR